MLIYIYIVILFILVNNSPILNTDGCDDGIVNVTKGSKVTLTCTRDSENAPGDLYQLIHPNGQLTPGAPADSPVEVTLNNITIKESGVYICQGSRNGISYSALQSNVTLNAQCEFYHAFLLFINFI